MKFTKNAFLFLLLGAPPVFLVPSFGRPLSSSSSTLHQQADDDDLHGAVSAARPAPQIALGEKHSCAIDNLKSLKCWGSNKYGQLGDGTNNDKSLPTIISLGDDGSHATQISLGGFDTCAIDNLKKLKCWGSGYSNMPTPISLGGDDATYATHIALGYLHSCVIDSLKNLKCWGWNREGQLGDGTNEDKSLPTIISLGDDGTYATQISLGTEHTCAIDNLNNLKCWGLNYFGQVGDGSHRNSKLSPTIISLGDDGSHATQIALGGYHTCAIDNIKNLKCWGYNRMGQIGDGSHSSSLLLPTIISLGREIETYPAQIALGSAHSCAIDNLKNLKCWGWNVFGQLGDGTEGWHNMKRKPTTISLDDGGNTSIDMKYATQISTGKHHTCTIDNINDIMCWGWNGRGQLGDGTTIDKTTPTVISSGGDGGGTDTACGCSTCTSSVLNRDANGKKVGDRIDWLKSNRGLSEKRACKRICNKKFPNVCGECNPNSCGTTSIMEE